MPKIDSSKLRNKFAKTLNQVEHKGKRIVVERHGKPSVVLVPVKDYRLLKKVMRRLEDASDLKASEAALREEGEIPIEEIMKRHGL